MHRAFHILAKMFVYILLEYCKYHQTCSQGFQRGEEEEIRVFVYNKYEIFFVEIDYLIIKYYDVRLQVEIQLLNMTRVIPIICMKY